MDQSVANTFWRRVLREGGSAVEIARAELLAQSAFGAALFEIPYRPPARAFAVQDQ